MFGIDRDPLVSFSTVFPKQLPNLVTRVLHLHRQLQTFERAAASAPEAPPQRGSSTTFSCTPSATLRSGENGWRTANFMGSRSSRRSKDVEPLTRKNLQSEFERLSAKFPKREALGVGLRNSSGSTGTPVRFERCSRLYMPLYLAVGYLCSRWHAIDQQKAAWRRREQEQGQGQRTSWRPVSMAWTGRNGL